MSKESLLKKEFKTNDVSRVRNLIKKDYNSKTKSSIGYKKIHTFYKEGDVWEEEGKVWTIRNGIRQNLTKLNEAKKLAKIPLICPQCSTSMNYWLHKKMYKIHGFCFDCTVEYETELRKAGLYEKYEQNLIKGSIKSFLNDLESWMEDQKESNISIVTEDGDVEDWKGSSKNLQNNLSKLQKFVNNSRRSLEG